MGAKDAGPTLEGLAQRLEKQGHRLEALERENERMRAENAALRREVSGLEGSETEQAVEETASDSDEKVSRRALLGKAAAAAVAATAAGTLLTPREARAETFVNVQSNSFVSAATTVFADGGVIASINSTSDAAVFGEGAGSVPGIQGLGDSYGVQGLSGHNLDGYGVEGAGDTGVRGISRKTGYSGVYGLHIGTAGYGLLGDGTGNGAGVLGRNAGGAGVEARDSRYGGKFDGSRAQLLLVPKGTAGRPTTGAHAKGELYVDSAGTLFVCTKGGTPGTWRKVSTTAA